MIANFELVEDAPQDEAAFPLAIRSPLESLFLSYENIKQGVNRVAAFMNERTNSHLSYFFAAASVNDRWAETFKADRLFDRDAAIKALDADYWQKAIDLTDVLDVMPAARRNEWHESIRSHTTPAFEKETVTTTLRDLLLQRERFFAERVDGLFRSLSGNHVTNAPEGFSKRMIVEYFLTYYGTTNYEKVAFVHDLRVIIATFMGREQPSHEHTSHTVQTIHRSESYGVWHDFDGGAFRIKLHKKGTAHLEVHPDIAWRMNMILAQLYPSAIPSKFRTRRKLQPRETPLTMDLLDEGVAVYLSKMRAGNEGREWKKPYITLSEKAKDQVRRTLTGLGAVESPSGDWCFEYDAHEAINYVIRVGKLPDDSYQFYETQPRLAKLAVDLAEIQDTDTILEPSAGQGGLACYLPADQLACIEISGLFAAVLRAKGFAVTEGDFLAQPACLYDKIVMNPPFSGNRAKQHVQHAAEHWLRPGGRLVAILPGSLKGATLVEGWEHSYSEIYRDEFVGTGVAVTILVLNRLIS